MQSSLELKIITTLNTYGDNIPLMYFYAYLPEYSDDEIDRAIVSLSKTGNIVFSESGVSLNRNFIIGDIADPDFEPVVQQSQCVQNKPKSKTIKQKHAKDSLEPRVHRDLLMDADSCVVRANMPIESVSLSVRINNCMKRNGLSTVDDFLFLQKDLLGTKGISVSAVAEALDCICRKVPQSKLLLSPEQFSVLQGVSHSRVLVYDLCGCLVSTLPEGVRVSDYLECLDDLFVAESTSANLFDSYCSNFNLLSFDLVEEAYESLLNQGFPVNKETFFVVMLPLVFDLTYEKDFDDVTVIEILKNEYLKCETLYDACYIALQNRISSLCSPSVIENEYEAIDIPDYPCFVQAAEKLAQLGGMSFSGTQLTYHHLTLDRWLDGLSEQSKTVLNLRFSGSTLQDAGDECGVTRERARQIEKKEFKDKPVLYEDKFKMFYPKYDITADEFESLSGQDKKVFFYLKLSCPKQPNKLSLDKMLSDEGLSADTKSRVRNYLDRSYVRISGKRVNRNRRDIIEALAEEVAQDSPVPLNEFKELYYSFIKEKQLDEKKFLFKTDHAFATFIGRSKCLRVIPGITKQSVARVHFHEWNQDEIDDLVFVLNEWSGFNIECSSSLLFEHEDYQDICEQMDIFDYSELYVVIKELHDDGIIEGANPGRIPMITFGEADRESQLVSLISEIGPVTVSDFADAYCKRYGVSKSSFPGTHLQLVSGYKSGDIYECKDYSFTEPQKDFICNQVKDGYLSLTLLKTRFHVQFADTPVSVITNPSLLEVGMHISQDLVVSNDCDLKLAFNRLLDEHADGFKISDNCFGNDVCSNSDFRLALAVRLRAFDLIEYEKNAYVSSERITGLSRQGSKDLLNEFADSAINFAGQDVPFNMKYLEKNGFSHPLMSIAYERGYDDFVLESAISTKSVGGVIKKCSISMYKIFCATKQDFSSVQLVEDITVNGSTDGVKECLDSDEIESILEYSYGIKVDGAKLREIFRRSSLIYDEYLDMAFASQEAYDNYKEELY